MSFTWEGGAPPEHGPLSATGRIRVGLRIAGLLLCLVAGLAASLSLRLIERPLFGQARPWTSCVTLWFFRACLRVIGLGYRVAGQPMRLPGAVVCNHASWLDIFVLNAVQRIYFVSKAEVARWPVIGWLARMVGTVFIERNPKQARAQTDLFRERLLLGHRLLFFPEGTSTDNRRVLPFRSTLFQSFFDPGLRERTHIQPVTLVYEAPADADPRLYGWWGDMEFGAHFLSVLALRKQGVARVIFHPPVRVAGFPDRKALARHLETTVRSGMPGGQMTDDGGR